MRDYLKSFFDEFEYDSPDRVAIAVAYEKITECQRAREKFLSLLSGYERDVKHLKAENASDIEEAAVAAGVHTYTAFLLTIICLSRTLRERLAKLGLSKKIISLTLSDFKWKLEECKKIYGVVGIEPWWWYTRFFDLRLFGIGRLQFELKAYEGEPYERDGKVIRPGDPTLAVHIPDCHVPLEERLCNAAYREAKKVFCSLLKLPDIPFTCGSWLLYPKNREFLDAKSNIAKFMNRFDIIRSGACPNDTSSSIKFLYSVKVGTPVELLPENSSLQRAYKAHMLSGGTMGYGFGVFFLEEKTV